MVVDLEHPRLRAARIVLARPRLIRSMREFAEQEVRIPEGRYEGRRYDCSRQPYSGLWFDAIDSGEWSRFVATGPSQSGKTLTCFVIPTLYHLCEIGETVVCGVPDRDMAGDKWRQDLLPAMSASRRLRALLPKDDGGRNPTAITLRNGATLRFMTGGGGDKSRAGFTTRVVVITETDGMDASGGNSREADKIEQLEARTRSYGDRARIYMECTVTVPEGRTWREYQHGTASRIYQRCPRCGRLVHLERKHLVGWRDAASVREAASASAWACPACEARWSEDERAAAAAGSVLVHDGQELTGDGSIAGEAKETDTLGFRWSAPDNLLVPASKIGVDEFRSAQDPDEDNAERKMSQFVWAVPFEGGQQTTVKLEVPRIQQRVTEVPRAVVPDGHDVVTVGIDVGMYLCWYAAIAWREGGSGQVIDYGALEVPTKELGEERAIQAALRQFRDEVVMPGYTAAGGEAVPPRMVLVDSGYATDTVYAVIRDGIGPMVAAKGYGATQSRVSSQRAATSYASPKATTQRTQHIGEQYHVTRLDGANVQLFEVNADYWKGYWQRRLLVDPATDGAVQLFRADPRDHLVFAKHMVAERAVEEFVPGKGHVTRWEQVNRNNHLLDACMLAAAASHYCGIRLTGVDRPEVVAPRRGERKRGKGRRRRGAWATRGGGFR